MFSKQPFLFRDPHSDYAVNNLKRPFADYIHQIKTLIAPFHHHIRARIEANAPAEFHPTAKPKYGALLIHGLLDTPFVMRDLGFALQQQGILTRSILLPGHGTVPGDLLNVKQEDWAQAVRYGVASFADEVEHIFLVGFSTGGSLAIQHVLQAPEKIAGLILLAPALKINSPFTFAAQGFAQLGKLWPRAAWFHIEPEIDYTKYRSFPFNAINQVYRVANTINNTTLPCPLFMTLSQDDSVVNTAASIRYFSNQTQPNNQLLLYTNEKHSSTHPNIMFRQAAFPDWRIKNFSHICLPIAPDNFHYGMQGDFPLASRVEQDKDIFYGEDNLIARLLRRTSHERLTFNPDFLGLVGEIKGFIESIHQAKSLSC